MDEQPERSDERDRGNVGNEESSDSNTIHADSEHEPTVSVSGMPERLSATPPEMMEAVGGYRIIGVLGRGGMGTVYEAEQSSPQRRVALKVMQRGHTVDEVHLRMFHHEAQALARLRHPGIAAIYESGHTPDGQDFFAMELVRGRTLGGWLDDRPRPMAAAELRLRLRLFRSLCEPVHYAHQRGVIHRDLKPANIRVIDEDESASGAAGVPRVKVLDFGLARITDPDMDAATLMHEVGVIRGTLPYMSPEQTRGDVDSVDVRTDVYALGVMLYEMLTDRRPYDLDSSSLVDAVRIICEAPPRPLNAAGGQSIRLDADLETIVGKALAKEPDRRYGTVAQLADDVDRYLASRPILARRPSTAYRAKKFVQRHRFGVAAATVVVLALLAGVAGTAVGLVRARHAEADARREAATSTKVSQFLADMLATADPQQVGRLVISDMERRVVDSVVAREIDPETARAEFRRLTGGVNSTEAGRRLIDEAILTRAGTAIGERFSEEPKVAGRLEHTLAETYERFGLYEQAMDHAQRAVEIRDANGGAESPQSLRSRALIGLLRYRLGEYSEAEDQLRRVHEAQRRLLGDDDPDAMWSAVRLSWVLIEQGRYEEAEPILEDVAARQRRVLGNEHRDTATTLNSLAVLYADEQRYAEAEALHSEVLAIRSSALGPSDPDTLKSMTNLAVVAFYQGRLDDAAALFAEVLEIQTETLGADHPVTLSSANNLAVIYERQGRLAEAESLHRRALEAKVRVLGENHPETLSSKYNLAILLTAQRHLDQADRLHRETLAARRLALGQNHPSTLDSICAVAGVAALRGDRQEALRRLAEAVDLGYRDADSLLQDSDFASLRTDPDFLAVVDRSRRGGSAD